MDRFKVSYCTKREDNLLVDNNKHFDSLQDAIKFVRTLQNTIGRPLLERSN